MPPLELLFVYRLNRPRVGAEKGVSL